VRWKGKKLAVFYFWYHFVSKRSWVDSGSGHRRSWGGTKRPCPPQISGKYSHFVPWEAFF